MLALFLTSKVSRTSVVLEAVEDTAITAQVSGYLQSRHFNEGQMVRRKNEVLYRSSHIFFWLKSSESTKASVAQANANLKKAERSFNRMSLESTS